MTRGSILSSLGAMTMFAGITSLAAASAPHVFMPGIISAPGGVDCLTFSPDGNTVFFDRETATTVTIMMSHRVTGHWSRPRAAPFSGHWLDHDPVVAPGGSYLIFTSNRPTEAGGKPLHGGQLWRVDRDGDGDGWGSPVRLPAIVNFGTLIFAPSVAANGDLYFQSADTAHQFHLFYAPWRDGHFQRPVQLQIAPAGAYEQDPAIAPDRSFIVFDAGYAGKHQPERLYIAYRKGDRWSQPVDLGGAMNRLQPWGAHLGPDGHTLYVTSDAATGVGPLHVNHIWSFDLGTRLPVMPRASGASASAYLTPAAKPGDRLDTIFSKAVAITGTDFEPLVRRVSGTASERITTAVSGVITENEQYVYDGGPAGSGPVTIRNHGITDCDARNKCTTNDSSSATTFDALLWGPVPDDVMLGSKWSVQVKAPWELGPPGTEQISVVRLDRTLGLITLERSGSGTGRSSDDTARDTFTIVSHGRSIQVKLNPGPATWHGRATFIHGITVADEIMLTRPVELVSDAGQVFHGTERIYTILTES